MKKIALLLSVVMLVSVFTLPVMAATSVNVLFDSETGLVTLDGDSLGVTTIKVTPNSVTSAGTLPTDFNQIIANGELDYDFYMPDSAPKGKYKVYVANDGGSDEDTFIYFSAAEAESVLADINSAGTKEEFLSEIAVNPAIIGIDAEDENYSQAVLETMYELYDSYADVPDFYDKYNFCLALCSFSGKSASQVETLLKNNQSVLGINFTNAYQNNTLLSSDSKTKLCQLLSAMKYPNIYTSAQNLTGKTDFPAVLEALTAIACAETASSWKALEEVYTKDISFLKNNVVSANKNYKSTNAQGVFSALLKKDSLTPADLKSNFDWAVLNPETFTTITTPSSNPGIGGVSNVGSTSGNTGGFDTLPQVGDTNNTDESDLSQAVSFNNPSIGTAKAQFPDVAASDWYHEPVSTLGGAGIVNGDTTGAFRPHDAITRAEFAKILVSAFSITGPVTEFADVSSADWYATFVSNAAGAGIVMGDENKNFMPQNNITRQDAALMIYRVSRLVGVRYTGFKEFKDRDDISLYAWDAVGTLYQNGIISGSGNGAFNPKNSITRAEAVQLLYNFIKDISAK